MKKFSLLKIATMSGILGIILYVTGWIVSGLPSYNFDLGDTRFNFMDFSSNSFTVLGTGNKKIFKVDAELEFSGIQINCDMCDVDVIGKNSVNISQLQVFSLEEDDVDYEIVDGILIVNIKSAKFISRSDSIQVTFTVPNNKIFDNNSFDIGMGDLSLQNSILTNNVIKLSMGDFTSEKVNMSNNQINLSMGQLEIYGEISGVTQLENSIGDIELELNSNYNSFNFDVICNVGKLEVNIQEYENSMGGKFNLNQSASNDIIINSSMGDVEITFTKGNE